MHIYDVVVVGGGIAGLSASKTFLENGITNFLILEAKEKAGGRIHTMPSGNSHVELGAQWIHGDDNEFFDLAKTTGHIHEQLSWEARGAFVTPSGEKVDDNLVPEILEWVDRALKHIEENFSTDAVQTNENSCPTTPSVGSFLRESFEKYLLESVADDQNIALLWAIFQWAMNFQRIDNSCHRMSDLSLFRWSEFKTNGGDLHHNFKWGAETFVQNAFRELLNSTKVKLNTVVTKVLWNTTDDSVEIQTDSGETFKTRTVLITVSIGVLQASAQSLFEPCLPEELTAAIQSTGFGPVTKLYLEWDEPWWTNTSDCPFQGLQLLWPNEYFNCCDNRLEPKRTSEVEDDKPISAWIKAITGFDPVIDNPNVLLAWVGGAEAIILENLEPDEVGKECMKLLKQFTKTPVPHPKRVLISKWNSDPFFRGAYCFRSTQGDQIPGDISAVLSRPVLSTAGKPVLLLAGEANSKTQYSTLHGAFSSGKSQAQIIIKILSNPNKC